jgi:hypothetical protein
VIHIRQNAETPRWLMTILDDLRAEADSGLRGTNAIVAKIADRMAPRLPVAPQGRSPEGRRGSRAP